MRSLLCSPPSRALGLIVSCAAILFASHEVAAGTGCLQNTLNCGFLCQPNPTYSTSPAMGCQISNAFASYDLVAGHLAAWDGGDYCDRSEVDASDNYTLLGIPGGTPLHFRVVVTAHASASCPFIDAFGSGFVSVTDRGTGSTAQASANCSAPNVSSSLQLTLDHAAGESFILDFVVSATGISGGTGSAFADISFQDLPPGAYVASCQGYGGAVAAQAATWGAVKAVYR